jgi:uncharacterized membrane protein YdfJ with MMPL/SSD domain
MAKTQTQERQSPETVSRKPTQLYRLGHTAAAHPWAFIATWVVVFVVAALLLPRLLQTLTGFPLNVSGSESQRMI